MPNKKKVIAVVAAFAAAGALGTAIADLRTPPALHDSPQLNAQLTAQNVTLASTIDRVECSPAAVSSAKGKAVDDDPANAVRGFKCDVHLAGQNNPVRWENYATDNMDGSFMALTDASLAGVAFSASKDANNATKVAVNVEFPEIANTQETAKAIKALVDQIGAAPVANSEAAQHAAQESARQKAWDATLKKNKASWSE